MKKPLLFCFLWLFTFAMVAQEQKGQVIEGPLSNVHQFENQALEGEHAAIFPLSAGLDSTLIAQTSDSSYFKSSKKINIQPMLNLEGGLFGNEFRGVSGAGITAKAKAGKRFRFRLNAGMYAAQLPGYLGSDSVDVLPGIGETIAKGDVLLAPYLSGAMEVQLGKYFSAEVGRGKHHWGDGYRSTVLSHNASPYPYARIATKIWKLKYVNLWTAQKDITTGFDDPSRRKFTTMHMLSFNLHKRFNINVFEAIVYQNRDTLSNRNLEMNYLNPIIFYRPVEFAQGSADNALLGFGMKYRGRNEWQVYSQVYFDEFLLFELRRRLGWWGNKFSVQLGAKKWNVLPGLHGLVEFNLSRPYTYTHGSVFQAYGHLNQGLAHPLETNFVEWINNWTYERGKWNLELTYMWAIFGRDTETENFGGNIFRSYANPSKQYDNYLAQGLKSTVHFAQLNAAYPIGNTTLSGTCSLGYRYEKNTQFLRSQAFLQLGIKSSITRPLYVR